MCVHYSTKRAIKKTNNRSKALFKMSLRPTVPICEATLITANVQVHAIHLFKVKFGHMRNFWFGHIERYKNATNFTYWRRNVGQKLKENNAYTLTKHLLIEHLLAQIAESKQKNKYDSSGRNASNNNHHQVRIYTFGINVHTNKT